MMSRELREKVLLELAEKKMTRTVFFHVLGEPLLHKEVYEAIRYANDLGLSVSLYTNGALLNEENTAQLLDSLEKGRVVIGLQDISQEGFEKRGRHHLSWADYNARLRYFVTEAEAKGTSAEIHCLVDMNSLGWNLSKISRAQKQIQSLYGQWLQFLGGTTQRPINIYNPAAVYPLGKTTAFFVKHEGTWANGHISNDMELIPNDRGRCAYMTDTFAVLADGTCTFCCSDFEGALNLGNANTHSLEEIYYGEKASALREAERKGRITHSRCQACRGTLVYKKTRRRAPQRNLMSEYYFFRDHYKRYGLVSSIQKTAENLSRRFLPHR